MSRPTSISWGDSAIDLVLPKPKVPSVLLIDQHRKEFQGALLRMVANDLSESIPVHWIDGGMAFDPSPLLPLSQGQQGEWEVLASQSVARLHQQPSWM